MTNPERFDFRGNDKTLHSLEKSWCVTDIMAACLLKITSLKAWLVTGWSARADFKSLVKNAQEDISSIIYTDLFLFRLTDGAFFQQALDKRQRNVLDTSPDFAKRRTFTLTFTTMGN